MWTKTTIAILGILGTIALALSNHYASLGNRDLEILYLVSGITLLALAAFLTIIQLIRWWFGLRYMRRPAMNDQRPPLKGNEKFKFGVYWDSDLNPLCPVCRTPLILSRDKLIYRIDGGVPLPRPEPHCLRCDKLLLLHDDDGNPLTLAEAKKLLSEKKHEKAIEPPKSQPLLSASTTTRQPSQSSNDDYQPDETERRILAYLFKDKVDRDLGSIIKALNFASTEEAKFHLERLIKYHYVDQSPVRASSPIRQCSLRQKGREFVIQNNLHREEAKPPTPDAQPLQPQTTDTPKPTDSYRPDKTAIKILAQLEKGGQTESELARVLNIEPTLISDSLRLLRMYEYVHLQAPGIDESYYELAQAGIDFLNKPDYKGIPHPSGPNSLDEVKTNILKRLADQNGEADEEYLAVLVGMRLVPLQVHLSDLVEQGYVTGNAWDTYNTRIFRLTTKAKRLLVNIGYFDN